MKTVTQIAKLSLRAYLSSLFTSIIVFSSLIALAQQPLPEVAVRFANPVFDCETQTYCLDVEFLSDTPGEELFGINVRFFYDNTVLEFISFGDFQGGYQLSAITEIDPLIPGAGQASFGFLGDGVLLNGAVELASDDDPIILAMDSWTKLFNVCFYVNVEYLGELEFCPSIVWDLNADGEAFSVNSDGVVITLVDPTRDFNSKPVNEQVVQFNWDYSDEPGIPYGYPVEEDCVSTDCQVPLSNWALYTVILLMFVFLFIRFRKII